MWQLEKMMIHLKLARKRENAETDTQRNEDDAILLYRAKLLTYLVESHLHTNKILCDDSYFSSISHTLGKKRLETSFIGDVNTNTRKCPTLNLKIKESIKESSKVNKRVKPNGFYLRR